MTFKSAHFKGSAYNCPFCGAYAHMTWEKLFAQGNQTGFKTTQLLISRCSHCTGSACWLGQEKNDQGSYISGRMIEPSVRSAPNPHKDMPPDVAQDYQEAADISQQSPRAAAALLAGTGACRNCGAGQGYQPNRQVNSTIKYDQPLRPEGLLRVEADLAHPAKPCAIFRTFERTSDARPSATHRAGDPVVAFGVEATQRAAASAVENSWRISAPSSGSTSTSASHTAMPLASSRLSARSCSSTSSNSSAGLIAIPH